MKREAVGVVDKDQELTPQLSATQPSQTPSKLLERRQVSSRRSSLMRVFSTDNFSRLVNKILRSCVRRIRRDADVTEGRSPLPDSDYAHLSEMIVRTALRENWDLRDLRMAAYRIQQMMFEPDSELVQVATYCDLEFVEDQSSQEQLLAITDILQPMPSVDPTAWSMGPAADGLLDMDLYTDTAASLSENPLIHK